MAIDERLPLAAQWISALLIGSSILAALVLPAADAQRLDYKFRPLDPVLYKATILVDPCKDQVLAGGRGFSCCKSSGIAVCQDHPEAVVAEEDLHIAYFQNAHIPVCLGEFESDPDCGSFIEIHKYGDYAIESSVELRNEWPNGFESIFIPTENLCAGSYELWWVVRTPSGPYVQYTKPFWVVDPSCDDPRLPPRPQTQSTATAATQQQHRAGSSEDGGGEQRKLAL
ncbi:unnamed protein product [Vitrella brassicaformis CCMP3155]|uniref:Uncharacterized protein n=1 Tax=Vitrella brassicaformis (strain CCMP3155) TaxID=1169540 RepID=A0A0G4ERV4_VITBC|nr:unnamed protein product [Vitrella brassicaformis CCMP3155]|eukprot:CEM00595.1 unnamed protein product [Vitrella brassicaformis CCMP3155]